MTNPRMDLLDGQRKLLVIWLLGTAPALLIVLARTFQNSNEIEKVWSWLLPSVMPTLSLVLGTYAATALTEVQQPRSVDVLFFRVSVALSLAYLAIISIAICVYPFSAPPATKILDKVSLVMGPVQGLVSACLGVFFISNSQGSKKS